VASGSTRPRLERDALTRLAYLAMGLWGFLLYALGPALPALRRELDIGRTVASLHTTLAALGFVVVGLTGDRVVARIGRRRAFWTAFAGASAGATVLGLGTALPVTLAGAAAMGLGGSLVVVLVHAALADRHGALSAAALSEANAVSVGLGATAPAFVGLAILAGGDWRAPVLAAALLAMPAVALAHRGVRFPPGDEAPHPGAPQRLPAAYWWRWLTLVLFVSAEFCVAFWSTDYLQSEVELGRSLSAALASLFLAGMAAGRVLGGRIARAVSPERLLPAALGMAAAGFFVFWTARSAPLSAAGLALCGLGIALLYPLTLALAFDTVPGRSDAASARATLGSGLAIAVAPFLLAALADRFGIAPAYGIVPALLAGGWLAGLAAGRARSS